MRNLLTRLIVVTALMVVGLAVVPMTASANNDPSSPQPVAADNLSDPPLPVTPPAPSDPPHVPTTYTVGTYIDKAFETSTDGLVRAVTVRRVEDLAYIANKLSLTTDEIKYSNPDKDTSNLKEGDQLTVPQTHGVVYKVQEGDNLTWIAESYQTTVDTIVQYNNITDADVISPDQILIIPGSKLPPLPPPTPVYTGVSRSGSYIPATGPLASSSGIPNRFTWGNCTWYVFNLRPIPWLGNAIDWWYNARAYSYSEGQLPRINAIVVENLSIYGHVALVTSVSANSFTVTEMNYLGLGVVDSRTIQIGAGEIVGFIY